MPKTTKAASGNAAFDRFRRWWLRRLMRRLRGAIAAFGHELVELGLVLGEAQPVEKLPEFLLLVLETLQGLHAVIVEGAIAAGRREAPGTAAAHAIAHPFHLVLPAILAV